jgi:hypothetical protein
MYSKEGRTDMNQCSKKEWQARKEVRISKLQQVLV